MSDGFVVADASTPEGRKAAVELMLRTEQRPGVNQPATISELWNAAVNELPPIWRGVIDSTPERLLDGRDWE